MSSAHNIFRVLGALPIAGLATMLTYCAASVVAPPVGHPANQASATAAPAPAFTSLAEDAAPGTVASNEAFADSGAVTSAPGVDEADAAVTPTRHDDHASHDTRPQAQASASLAPELTTYEQARPVFERFCAACHSSAGARRSNVAMRHFAMDGYPFGGHHAHTVAAAVREALGASGSPATMPLDHPGTVRGEDLALVLAWADAFEQAHPRPSARDRGSQTRGREPQPARTAPRPHPHGSEPRQTTPAPAHSHHHEKPSVAQHEDIRS